MVVVLVLDTGESYSLDRSLGSLTVAEQVNAARGKGQLIAFQTNHTPSRIIYIDPDHVVAVKSDGHAY